MHLNIDRGEIAIKIMLLVQLISTTSSQLLSIARMCGFPVVRTDGRWWSVYGHVITKFSWMDRFSYLWHSEARARLKLR